MLTLDPDGGWGFAPATTFDGTATFAVTVSDGATTVGPVTMTLLLPAGYSVLQILHASDGEAGIGAIEDLPRFSAVLQALRGTMPASTLTLSSGDNWLPSPFYNAAGDPTAAALPGIGAANVGRGDIAAMNAMGFQASCFGNHEFDAGTREVRNILRNSGAWNGAQFPYLGANLDFTANADLGDMVAADGQTLGAGLARRIAGSVVAEVDGTSYGIVGATTPLLPRISSPGTVVTSPSDPIDYDALAAIIQFRVDALRTAGIDRIVLLAHMQQYQIEADELAHRLDGVDIIIAGGSHAIFADGDDRLRSGDAAAEECPLWRTSAGSEPVAVLQAGANWRYVGRFVATFDQDGVLIPTSVSPQVCGVYATDAQGVADLGAGGLIDATVQAIATGLGSIINAKDGEVLGYTAVFLNGLRASVRTQETNLGSLSADANLHAARSVDDTTVLSLKNGGGIRDAIGTVGTGSEPSYLPPQANPSAGKPEGGVSRLDIENSLRFNNSLALATITAAQLKEVLEHAVAGSAPGQTPGQFPQVGGVEFAWDPAGTPQVLGGGYAVVTPGTRIRTVQILHPDGTPADLVVHDGAIVGDPDRTFRLVSLNFLIAGGDGYPFPRYESEDATRFAKVDLSAGAPAGFATAGYEQAAMASHLADRHPSPFTAYATADTGPDLDRRIQNLSLRTSDFAPSAHPLAITATVGTARNGTLVAMDPDGSPLSFSATSPAKGTLLLNVATGAFVYTAYAGSSGSDSFTFTAWDGTRSSNTAAVTITLSGATGGSIGSNGSSDDGPTCGAGSAIGLIALGMLGAGLRRREIGITRR